MFMGCTCKFFGFSISYTIINLPLSILYLTFMLLISCTFSSTLPSPLPTDNPPCDLHFCDSVPVVVGCLVYFCVLFFLGSVVDSCEFVVISLFVLLIFFLYKSCGMTCPTVLSQLPWMRIRRPGHILLFQWERGGGYSL